VPSPDDERFETYLKQFQPLVPDALPINKCERVLPRHWVFGMWSAGAAAVILLCVISLRTILSRVSGWGGNPQSVSVNQSIQPLTMRDANSILSTAPSYKAALDKMAFQRQRSTVPKDKQSAVTVLAKEKIKL